MVKAVIFDIGGVIAYDVWENLILDDLITNVYKIDSKTLQIVGERLWNDFAHRRTTDTSDWRKLEKEYWGEFVKELNLSIPVSSFIEITNKYIKPLDGMLNLLEELNSKGIKLGICSNNTEFWFERQWLKFNLYTSINPNCVVLSSRVGVSKSSPNLEMFQAILVALRVEKGQCLFVDDREENIEQALEYGLTSILFPTHIEKPALYLRSLLLKLSFIK